MTTPTTPTRTRTRTPIPLTVNPAAPEACNPRDVATTGRASRPEAFAKAWRRSAVLAADLAGRAYLAGGVARTAAYLAEARASLAAARVAAGLSDTAPPVLKAGDRLHKFDRDGRGLVYVLNFAPAALSGYNVCPASTPGCRAGCVGLAGRNGLPGTTGPRVVLTRWAAEHADYFVALLIADLEAAIRRAARLGLPLYVRLNNYADQDWHGMLPWLAEAYPAVTFYDYTKRRDVARRAATLANVDVTWSVSERDEGPGAIARAVAEVGRAYVVIPADMEVPPTVEGLPTVDGDASDLRPLDGVGVVVCGHAKGYTVAAPFVREHLDP